MISASRRIGALAAALAVVAAAVGGSASASAVSRDPERAGAADLAGLLSRYHVPGASVALLHAGRVRSIVAGDADEATRRRVTPDTTFQVGSVSKTVTAAAVLTLVDAGRIGLDERVAPRLRRWHLPAAGAGITVRDLLDHTGGTDVAGYEGRAAPAPVATVADSLAGRTSSPPVLVTRRPGRFRYSGGGYAVLQLLVEDVTGTTFADYVRDHVLAPAGMRSSSYADGPAEAAPYARRGIRRPYRQFAELGPEGLRTTAPDLARLLASIMAADGGRSGTGLSPRAATAMLSGQPGTRGADGLTASSAYGLGVFRSTGAGRAPVVWHPGVNPGWAAMYAAAPDRGDAVVVLTNGDTGIHVAAGVVCRWAHDDHVTVPEFCRVIDDGTRALAEASGPGPPGSPSSPGGRRCGPSPRPPGADDGGARPPRSSSAVPGSSACGTPTSCRGRCGRSRWTRRGCCRARCRR